VSAYAVAEPVAAKRCACGGVIGADGMCAKCRAKRLALRRRSAGPAPRSAPSIVHEVLRSGGQPLDPGARGAAEARLGHDFGRVRVHTDERAAESAAAVRATAYSVGDHIVFGRAAYAPATPSGRALLRHELVHTLQHDGSAAIPDRLPIGAVDDEAEHEADRLATGPVQPRDVAVRRRPAALRRRWTTAQRIDESRAASLPDEHRGSETVRIHVTRTLVPCPCSRVLDTREGVFYNPDLDNLAIAYRHCRGGRTVDVYGRLEQVGSSFLSGTAPTAGTGTAAIDVNVVGRVVSGRVVVEALGTQVGGAGIGGHAQIVFQGGEWRVFLEPQFIQRLASAGGTTAQELEVSLGGRVGRASGRVDMRNLLDPAQRSIGGAACLEVTSGTNLCLFPQSPAGGGFQITGGIQGSIGGPEVRREECFQCLCPPPARVYSCIEDVLPRSETVTEDVQVQREEDLRYYFRLDRTDSSEESELRTASDTALGTAVSRLGAGGSAVFILGYASPEADERLHNQDLSQRRAEWLRATLASRVGASVALPEASGAGELLGRKPQPTPSSRLGEAIRPMGFRSAELLTPFLLGEEIPRAELREQFVSLFNTLDTPADRLALFGLTPDDPIAPGVLRAVDEFLRSRGGTRPWERIFRRLRYAVIRVRRTVTEPHERTIEHQGSSDRLPDSECRPYSREAERANLFGPVDPAASRPTATASEREGDCPSGPAPADTQRGCDYRLPASARLSPTAPDVAPQRLGP
jgi:hypothetical protein